MNPASCRGRGHSIRGASLIEVMVAVLILGFGVLGVAAMQLVAMRNAQSSLERSQAVAQSYAVFDAMRANALAARANAYTMDKTCTVPAAGTLVANDKRAWIQGLHAALGTSACGTISCAASVCTVTVEWTDPRATDAVAAQSIVTRSRI